MEFCENSLVNYKVGRSETPTIDVIRNRSTEGICLTHDATLDEPDSLRSTPSRRPNSSSLIPASTNRFWREVAPVSKVIWAALNPRHWASTNWIAAFAFPLSGGEVTATRIAPARSPRIALRFAPG